MKTFLTLFTLLLIVGGCKEYKKHRFNEGVFIKQQEEPKETLSPLQQANAERLERLQGKEPEEGKCIPIGPSKKKGK